MKSKMNYTCVFSMILLLVSPALAGWKWTQGSSSAGDWGEFGRRNETSVDSYTHDLQQHRMTYHESDRRVYFFGGDWNNGNSDNIWFYLPNPATVTWLDGSRDSYATPLAAPQPRLRPHVAVHPGGRTLACMFLDEDFVWIFGGFIQASVVTNTVFRFDLNIMRWAWVSGRVSTGSPGNFGVKGVEASSNDIPAVYGFAYGYDKSLKTLFVHGGAHIEGGTSVVKKMSATWSYNITSMNWTWIHGPSEFDSRAIYGNRTVGTPQTVPGARFRSAFTYVAQTQTLYMFGGFGLSIQVEGSLNDLWAYDVKQNIWTFMTGDIAPDSGGRSGTRNVYSPSYLPRARMDSSLVYNPSRNGLLLFGGLFLRASSPILYNDLWRYSVDDNMWAWIAGSLSPNAAGSFGNKGVESDSNNPPPKSGHGYTWDTVRNLMIIHGGAKVPSGSMNDVWEFDDDGPETPVEQVINEDASTTVSSEVLTTFNTRARTNFASEDIQDTNSSALPIGAVIAIAGGAALVLVFGALITMMYIRRQSFKEAYLAEANVKDSTTVADETGLASIENAGSGSGTKVLKLGSSTIDLSVVKSPSPIVRYTADSVAAAKSALANVSPVDGFAFDCVLQIGTQNGAAIFNAISGQSLKSRTDRLTVKVYGRSIQALEPGVEDAFWEEAALLQKLSSYDIRCTSLIAYCAEPVALLIPAYPLGTLETYLTQQVTLKAADVFNIVFDIAKTLKVLHELGYAHRNVKLRNIFVEKDKAIHGVLTGMGGLQLVHSDDHLAVKAFPNYRVDAKAANFVAPEVFNALRGQTTLMNASIALKSGDLFSWAILISKLLKAVK